MSNRLAREVFELTRERRRDQLRACKGLHYLADHGYLAHGPYFITENGRDIVVHTVLFPSKGKREGMFINHCPICGSAFVRRGEDQLLVPNCAKAEEAPNDAHA